MKKILCVRKCIRLKPSRKCTTADSYNAAILAGEDNIIHTNGPGFIGAGYNNVIDFTSD